MLSLPKPKNSIGSVVIEILSFSQKNLTTLYNKSLYIASYLNKEKYRQKYSLDAF